jgi:hypothetical protein
MLRSPLLDDPNAIFSPKKMGRRRKAKKVRDLRKKKTLDGADIVRDGRLSPPLSHGPLQVLLPLGQRKA